MERTAITFRRTEGACKEHLEKDKPSCTKRVELVTEKPSLNMGQDHSQTRTTSTDDRGTNVYESVVVLRLRYVMANGQEWGESKVTTVHPWSVKYANEDHEAGSQGWHDRDEPRMLNGFLVSASLYRRMYINKPVWCGRRNKPHETETLSPSTDTYSATPTNPRGLFVSKGLFSPGAGFIQNEISKLQSMLRKRKARENENENESGNGSRPFEETVLGMESNVLGSDVLMRTQLQSNRGELQFHQKIESDTTSEGVVGETEEMEEVW
jgi:hypothetical protein